MYKLESLSWSSLSVRKHDEAAPSSHFLQLVSLKRVKGSKFTTWAFTDIFDFVEKHENLFSLC